MKNSAIAVGLAAALSLSSATQAEGSGTPLPLPPIIEAPAFLPEQESKVVQVGRWIITIHANGEEAAVFSTFIREGTETGTTRTDLHPPQ